MRKTYLIQKISVNNLQLQLNDACWKESTTARMEDYGWIGDDIRIGNFIEVAMQTYKVLHRMAITLQFLQLFFRKNYGLLQTREEIFDSSSKIQAK